MATLPTGIQPDKTDKHTPGSCGCCLEVGWKIVFCPLHAAAPDLLAACDIGPLLRDAAIQLEADFADTSYALHKAADRIVAAIAKAVPDPLDEALDACDGEIDMEAP